MGVLNLTPDSFSDGGKYISIEAAVAQAEKMIADGADLLDVGGESTRPGAAPVSSAEQIRRVVPSIQAIADRSDILLSIDTTRSDVAAAACDAGARLINDISAGRDDHQMLTLAATRQVPIVLMHMQGTPLTMQLNPTYGDVVTDVAEFLISRRQAAIDSGIDPKNVLLDPGIGFGKTDAQNLTLLRDLARLATLGSPLVVGTSRKGFIGRITGESDPGDRILGTAATVAWSAANGAEILRVHDVSAMRKIVAVVRAIIG